MTWIKFALWLCALYIFYYLLIILWDIMKNRMRSVKGSVNELTFSENVSPVSAMPEYNDSGDDDPVISSGGVSLKQMFSLAREEAIEYIRPVSFLA